MVTGEQRWYIIGCYLSPNNTSTIESVLSVFKKPPWGAELLVLGNLNVKLLEP